MPQEKNHIELRSEQVQDILEAVPNWMIRWGNTLIILLIVMLLCVSWFVKYPDIILSEAIITTKIPPQKEYAKISGEILAVLVNDNEKVHQNQVLAILENTANYEDVYKLKVITDTIQINTKSFDFPVDSLPVLFLGEIDSHYALFENNYIQYQLNKMLRPFSNEVLANKYSISELNKRLQNALLQRDISKTELDFKSRNLKRQKTLFEKGIISTQDYEDEQLEYAQAERSFKNFESLISQIREHISNAQKTSRGSEINKIKEEMILLKNVIQSFNQLKKAIKDWEHQYVLKSNINGTVSFLNYWNTNQAVKQGDLIFTIVPSENSSFMAKLKTPALNSGKIKINQNVIIKLESYPDVEFGVINGTIKNISLVPNSEGLYLIHAELPNKLITSYNKEIDFKQEMRGSAEIITEDLRLIERFFYQFKEIIKR